MALLIAGRRLFWLFVGLVGFFMVYQWFELYSGAPSSWHWGVAIAAGLLGILLAIFRNTSRYPHGALGLWGAGGSGPIRCAERAGE